MTTFEIPTSAYPRCLRCGEPARRAALHEITGFERERSAGGTNHVIARKRTGRIVCPDCADKVQRGTDPEQGGLF